MSYEFKVGYARENISPMDPVPLSGIGTNATRICNRVIDLWIETLKELYKNS